MRRSFIGFMVWWLFLCLTIFWPYWDDRQR
jgi:hypothetical protein